MRATIAPRELALAKQLLDNLRGKWDHARFHDTFQDRLKQLIQSKARAEDIAARSPAEAETGVIDLMDALKASLGQTGQGTPGAWPPPTRPSGVNGGHQGASAGEGLACASQNASRHRADAI